MEFVIFTKLEFYTLSKTGTIIHKQWNIYFFNIWISKWSTFYILTIANSVARNKGVLLSLQDPDFNCFE